jgi:polyvinyl alcohol dehydrogenase (cytochrome)
MMWGSAADGRLAYFPVTRGGAGLGLAAVGIGSGEVAWRATPAEGAAAPVSVMPGIVFLGTSTGTLHAYATATGTSVWSFETNRTFETVNGVAAKGGGINSVGPIVAAGMVLVTSGYSDLGGGNRGNVLLAFGVR